MLARNLGRDLVFAEDITAKQRSAMVTISVEEVTGKVLVENVAASAGLVAELDEEQLRIVTKKTDGDEQ